MPHELSHTCGTTVPHRSNLPHCVIHAIFVKCDGRTYVNPLFSPVEQHGANHRSCPTLPHCIIHTISVKCDGRTCGNPLFSPVGQRGANCRRRPHSAPLRNSCYFGEVRRPDLRKHFVFTCGTTWDKSIGPKGISLGIQRNPNCAKRISSGIQRSPNAPRGDPRESQKQLYSMVLRPLAETGITFAIRMNWNGPKGISLGIQGKENDPKRYLWES